MPATAQPGSSQIESLPKQVDKRQSASVEIPSESPPGRLSLQDEPVAADTTALRSLDWDRSRFDIEFGLRNGTTYNAFLIGGERWALVDTSHAKFRASWLALLQSRIDPCRIDHLIVSHTEPDHSSLIGDVLDPDGTTAVPQRRSGAPV